MVITSSSSAGIASIESAISHLHIPFQYKKNHFARMIVQQQELMGSEIVSDNNIPSISYSAHIFKKRR
jgi:hypothetical protein